MGDGVKQWPHEVTVFLNTIRKEHGLAAEVRVLRDLRKLAERRHQLRDISKPLDDSLFELVTSHNKMEYRCIYAFHHPEIVVLVCFVKKTRKTPPRYLETARKRNSQISRKEVSLGDITLH